LQLDFVRAGCAVGAFELIKSPAVSIISVAQFRSHHLKIITPPPALSCSHSACSSQPCECAAASPLLAAAASVGMMNYCGLSFLCRPNFWRENKNIFCAPASFYLCRWDVLSVALSRPRACKLFSGFKEIRERSEKVCNLKAERESHDKLYFISLTLINGR
jgi:hypothetical protein